MPVLPPERAGAAPLPHAASATPRRRVPESVRFTWQYTLQYLDIKLSYKYLDIKVS
jgi:hypothetical protein